MNTALYYFSGTGNSLSVARSIKKHFDGSELIPIIASLKQKSIEVKAQRVGLIFPMHFMGVPRVVVQFLKDAIFQNPQYVFVVITGANPKLGDSLSQVQSYLKVSKVRLSAGFFVPMVAAHFPYLNLSKAKLPNNLYQEAQEKVIRICEDIRYNKNAFDKEFTLFGKFKYLVQKEAKDVAESFTVDNGCIRCGYCMQVCPFENIRLNGKHVQWLDNCHRCFACLHFCSQSVIQYKKLSVGKPRHHHPSIDLSDIAFQRG